MYVWHILFTASECKLLVPLGDAGVTCIAAAAAAAAQNNLWLPTLCRFVSRKYLLHDAAVALRHTVRLLLCVLLRRNSVWEHGCVHGARHNIESAA